MNVKTVCNERWQSIKNISEIQSNEWLYYIDDQYFGKVIKAEKNQVHLHIQHFRIPSSAYIAKISDASKLERPIDYIFIDWQIQEMFPLLYANLEKSFIIWKKLEPFIIPLEKEKRKAMTPEPFLQCGKILGKWMASGYLNITEIQALQSCEFDTAITHWQKIELVANDDSIDDDTLYFIDKIREIDAIEAHKLSEQGRLVLWQWVVLKAGFYHRDISM